MGDKESARKARLAISTFQIMSSAFFAERVLPFLGENRSDSRECIAEPRSGDIRIDERYQNNGVERFGVCAGSASQRDRTV